MTSWPILVSAALVALFGGAAHAYKPAPLKDIKVYVDAQKTAKVVLTPKGAYGPAKVTIEAAGKVKAWNGSIDVPTMAVVSSTAERVVLLGGYGNPSVELGKVVVYDFDGRELKRFEFAD